VATKPPWYAFLYKLLGAHGTFWLWVVAVATLWWTWQGALVSMLNRFPEKRSVADASEARDTRRWVVLPGVQVVLDGQLLFIEESESFQGTAILIDQDEPCAKFWRTTRAIAEADADARDERFGKVAGACSDVALLGVRAGRADAHQNLVTRLLRLQKYRDEQLPKAEGALLLLADDVAPATSSGPIQLVGGDPESYDRLLETWRKAVLANVRVESPRGLLVTAPSTIVDRVKASPGIPLGSNALRVNRTPSDLELYAFCSAALVFLFLATGLWGVVHANRAPSP
jgi:hypothetical protein